MNIFLKHLNLKHKERKEIYFSTESWSVKALKQLASEELNIPLENICLIYNGRILQCCNQLSYYKIVKGCTIFYTRRILKVSAPPPDEPRISSSFTSLTTNKKMLSMIGRILSNPSLLRNIIAGTPLEQNPTIINALANPDQLSTLSDPNRVGDYLNDNPNMAALIKNMLQHSMETVEEDVLEAQDREQGREERLRTTRQEEMFEHSQAIHAHQQQTQVNTPHQAQEFSTSQFAPQQHTTRQQHHTIQRQNSGGAITQDQLASALAGAMSNQASPLSSLSMSHSGPSSLSGYSNQTTIQPVQESNDGGQSEIAGSISRQSSVTTDSLQEALASAMSNVSSSVSTQHGAGRRLPPQEKYKTQLEQLRLMGIRDDVVSIQALDATGGNIQAALEIIYTG